MTVPRRRGHLAADDPNDREIERLARYDSRSWWTRGRRALVGSVLRKHANHEVRGLVGDVGCGAGSMFEVMREYGPVIGIDVSERAAGICRAKGYRAVTIGSVDNLPLVSSSLWMIGLTDVLEHIEDDRKALIECARVLEPRGVLLVTVPACRWLYGEHDQALGHFRRYSARQMKGLLEQCGFRVTRMTHYNTLLFPLVSATRIVSRALRGRAAQADPLNLPDPLNWFAHMMLQAERLLLSRGNLPFGLSLLCVAMKEPQPSGASGRPLGPLA